MVGGGEGEGGGGRVFASLLCCRSLGQCDQS